MEIQTKFKPGDYVWRMKNNQPLKEPIEQMRIFSRYESGSLHVSIQYAFDYTEKFCNESDLFSTKEDLKKSIFG